MQVDKRFLLCGFVYAILGMGLGNYMGASHNHEQFVTHAHILLVGFVVSVIYGVVHKLWLADANKTLAAIQFYLHQLAALAMFVCLFAMFGQMAPEATLGPVLGLSSTGVLFAAILMFVMLLKSCCRKA